MATDAAFYEELSTLTNGDAIGGTKADAKAALQTEIDELALAGQFTQSQLYSFSFEDSDKGCNITKFETPPAGHKTRAEKEVIQKRKYHQRLKNERDRLRQMVSELSHKLQKLQQGSNSISPMISANSAWRQIALHQRDQRAQSEKEQIRLFAEAKTQARYIQKLCQQLPGDSGSTKMLAPAASTRPYNPAFDHSKYLAHIQRVNACHAEVDEILREFDESSVGDGVKSSLRRRRTDGEVEFFQHLNKFTEPYNYEQTHRTMWKLARLHHRQQDRQDFEGLGDPNDTVVIRFRLVRTLTSGSTVSVLQRYVHRRFVENNRTVLVWKTLSEGEDAFHGMHSEETGWVCLQPSTEDGATLVRICVRQAPMRFGLNYGESFTREFQEVLQTSVGEDMVEISSALDKMLLDDTLEGIDIQN
ncbi:unnamed protein product [Phytophthora lilii]|uniref:Unnamed protein product n=1 Tax=Phytophthora lilii TaxID=2077276 RepID=A0A9W6U1Z6_9STRA|nr:unnamed protein product [Phytophthora lilii]